MLISIHLLEPRTPPARPPCPFQCRPSTAPSHLSSRMGHYSLDQLHIHYYDFAYEPKGPFRMANGNIGDATAKIFAE